MRQDGGTATAGDPEGWWSRMPGRPACSSGRTYIDQGQFCWHPPPPVCVQKRRAPRPTGSTCSDCRLGSTAPGGAPRLAPRSPVQFLPYM